MFQVEDAAFSGKIPRIFQISRVFLTIEEIHGFVDCCKPMRLLSVSFPLKHTVALCVWPLLLLAGCDSMADRREVVKVGVLHSLTGTMAASEEPVVRATLMAVEAINREGLIPGVRVEAVVADGASDAGTFAREARRLIVEEGVQAIFGCWTSDSRKAVKPVVERYGSVLFYPMQYEGMEASNHIVYLGSTPNQQLVPAVYWAMREKGARRFYLIGSDYIYPRASHAIVRDQLQAFGAEVVGESFLPLGASDVSAVVADILAEQPDMILNTLNGSTNRYFFRKLREAGVSSREIPTLSFSLDDTERRHCGLANTAGDYVAWTYYEDLEHPMNDAFVNSFRQIHGTDEPVSDPMYTAYMGVRLWAAAAARAYDCPLQNFDHHCAPQAIDQYLGWQNVDSAMGRLFMHRGNRHLFKIARVARLLESGGARIVWESDIPVRPEPYPPFRSVAGWDALLESLSTDWGGQWTAP